MFSPFLIGFVLSFTPVAGDEEAPIPAIYTHHLGFWSVLIKPQAIMLYVSLAA